VVALCDAAVHCLRELTGYDRVMVYRFDPDGHGQIIAEARAPRLESLLGHHYPATDIPQRARELYLRNRVRVLVDVHYAPAPIVPRLDPATGQELDLSLSYLRSMSPLHLQYLENMGVTATLVISLVREGRLWGLVACHHDTPRNLRYAVRAAADLLGEVIATRLAAIENAAHAQVAIQVRRLEQRLIEATSAEGDWKRALFRNPSALLQPLDATGAVLCTEGELLTAGEVPSSPQLRALIEWIDAECGKQALFQCGSVARANPALAALTPAASGVVAVRLAGARPDFLVWLRKEQLSTVTWAGDPSKPMLANDPLELSPRRSFAAWSEIVRGTAVPWSGAELSLARAFGTALVDIIVQIHAVRLLIAEHQLTQVRATLHDANQPVVIASVAGQRLTCNDAFCRLAGSDRVDFDDFDALAERFDDPPLVRQMLGRLLAQHLPWRGELVLRGVNGAAPVPVAVRAEVVPGRDGAALGGILILSDLTDTRRAEAARRLLEASLARDDGNAFADDQAQRAAREPDPVLGAILTHASLAAMDITDVVGGPAVAPLLEELEASTQRATALYGRIRAFGGTAGR
jgi:PAS domain-containing protein